MTTTSTTIETLIATVPKTPYSGFPAAEPDAPRVVTAAVPGPKSQQLIDRLSQMQDSRHVSFFQDPAISAGNYIGDADGNLLLDVYCHISSVPFGYNHPAYASLCDDPDFRRTVCQRPALGVFPFVYWPDLLERTLLKVKPHPELSSVFTSHTGSDANEFAFKTAIMWKAQHLRGGSAGYNPWTPEEMSSCMKNQCPGASDLQILSFSSAFHGRTFGALSATRSKPMHKIDIPAFKWPCAPFPKLRYPLRNFEKENRAEEEHCLAELERILIENKKVAAVIVEPVQAEGGDRHATPFFFCGVREITERLDVLMIVDEVQTGVLTCGSFWAHQRWHLPTPPDIVSFSKKAQCSGFYYKPSLLPSHPYRNFNTWMGDPLRVFVFGKTIELASDPAVLQNVEITGKYLLEGLEKLAEKYPKMVSNARGLGTFCALDFHSQDDRNKFISAMRVKGVNIGSCGDVSVRLRPSLVFLPKHAALFLEQANKCLADLSLPVK